MKVDLKFAEQECLSTIKQLEAENLKLEKKITEFTKAVELNNNIIASKRKIKDCLQHIIVYGGLET